MRYTRLLLIAWVLAIVGFTAAAVFTDVLPGDVEASLWLVHKGGKVGQALRAVAWIGQADILAFGAVGGGILLLRKRWWEAAGLLLLAGTALVLPEALKDMIARPRPSPHLIRILGTNDGYSYPSGHVYFAMAILGGLAAFARPMLGNRWLAWTFQLAMVGLITDIGLSRMYRGAHWASDVIGTLLIAGLLVYAVAWGVRRLNAAKPSLRLRRHKRTPQTRKSEGQETGSTR